MRLDKRRDTEIVKVTSVIDNTSAIGMPTEHGLSLYIQSKGCKILFDMGQGILFAENVGRVGLDIADVDMAVVSHGHYDHGGGLRTFLELNSKAKVYIHKDAFQPHFSLRPTGLAYIGLDKELADNKRLIVCGDINNIDDRLTLFADVHGNCCQPNGNRLLFGPDKNSRDTFTHEQNLIVNEDNNTILFAGCAHCGIVNIIRKAEQVIGKTPTHVIGGMHLVKSGLDETEENKFIASLSDKLKEYKNTQFHTMHCTGTDQFNKLRTLMGDQISYLSCGESIEI